MPAQRTPLALVLLLLAGCGERAVVNETGQGSTTPPYVRAESGSLLSNVVQPVRIGEAGPNFAACNARGSTRDRNAAGPVTVRAAPFAEAEEIDRLAAGAEFFICARTNDQRWFGIVYDEGGRADERCGVSVPAANRGNYQGPCAAGWVATSAVRLISGVPHEVPASSPVEG